ncbi:MAG: hypothetical protein QOG54_2871 [Actinomycetota bacterium]|nr:hypothetical protein [Actinomycetota bacterium]
MSVDNRFVTNIRTERGIIVDWIIKLLIGLAIVGVIGFDAASILVNSFTLDSGADDIAISVSTGITGGNKNQFTDLEIYDLAVTALQDPDNGVSNAKVVKEGTGIDPQTGEVTVKLRRTASTVIVKHIGAIKHWAVSTAESSSTTQ